MKSDAEKQFLTEYGFWIYVTTSKNRQKDYIMSEIQRGASKKCHEHVNIIPNNPSKQDVSQIPFAGCYPIAYFHTHTAINSCKCPGSDICKRDVGFTAEDKTWANANGMPLFVYHYIATGDGYIKSTDDIDSQAEYYEYRGMKSRPTPLSITGIEFIKR